LNLISQQLDTIYQIKPKRATVLFLHLFAELNTPLELSSVVSNECRGGSHQGDNERSFSDMILP
jgi:hypothetical protein